MRTAAFAALDCRPHDRLGNRQHEADVARRMPPRVVAARARHSDARRPLTQLQDRVEAGLEPLLFTRQAGAILHRLLELLLQQVRILFAIDAEGQQEQPLFVGDLAVVDLPERDLLLVCPGGSPRPASEHEQVGQRISTEPVGTVQPGCHLAGGVKTGKRGRSGLGLDSKPAHRVVDSRRHLHRFLCDVDVGQPQELLVHRRQLFLDRRGAQVGDIEESTPMLRAAPRLDFLVDRPGHHVAGGELLLLRVVLEHEPLAIAVLQIAAFTPDRLGDQDAANPGRPDHAGRMELHHLRIEHLRPGVEAHGDAVAGAFPGVRGDFEDPAPAAGRQDDGLRSKGDEAAVDPVIAEGADHAVSLLEQSGQSDLHVDLDAELHHPVLQAADHFQPGAVAHVAQPSIGMRPKGALHNPPVGRAVEDRAVGLEFVDPVG